MKYPFLFLLVSVLLATFIFVVVGAAVFAELKELRAGKASAKRLAAD